MDIKQRVWRPIAPSVKAGAEVHYTSDQLIEIAEELDFPYLTREVETAGLGWTSTETEVLFLRKRHAEKVTKRLGFDPADGIKGQPQFWRLEVFTLTYRLVE